MTLIRGNPIVLVLTTIVFSVISLTLLLSSWSWIHLVIAVCIFYSTIGTVVFYLAYRRSEFAFMSPKKYKKSELVYEKNQRLYDLLIKIDKKNASIKPDNAIDKAMEMISKME